LADNPADNVLSKVVNAALALCSALARDATPDPRNDVLAESVADISESAAENDDAPIDNEEARDATPDDRLAVLAINPADSAASFASSVTLDAKMAFSSSSMLAVLAV